MQSKIENETDSENSASAPTTSHSSKKKSGATSTPTTPRTRKRSLVHPLVQEQAARLKEAKTLAKLIGGINTLTEWGLEQVQQAVNDRQDYLKKADKPGN